MTVMAFVAINTEPGEEKQVHNALRNVEGVDPYMVYGRWDIFAEIIAPNFDSAMGTYLAIKRAPGVQSVLAIGVDMVYKIPRKEPETVPVKPTPQ